MVHQEVMKEDNDKMGQSGQTLPLKILEKLSLLNIESRPIWKPMHMQPIFESCDFIQVEKGMSVGTSIFHRGLCLPSDIKMTEEQQNIVIDIIKECFD